MNCYEFVRILNTEKVELELTDEDVDLVTEHVALPQAYKEGFRLFKDQAKALIQYKNFGGGFLGMSCGAGKTLTGLLIAQEAFLTSKLFDNPDPITGAEKILIMIPANLHYQYTKVDIPAIRNWIKFPFKVIDIPEYSPYTNAVEGDEAGVYVLTHSLISVPAGKDLIDKLKPDLIIIDEAHAFANESASRTGRLLRYLKSRYNTKGVVMSGTLTNTSVSDYAYQANWCLKENSPLPSDDAYLEVELFGRVISSDKSNQLLSHEDLDSFKPLVKWAELEYPVKFSEKKNTIIDAFHSKLKTSPGVVISTGEDAVGASLYFDKVNATIKKDDPLHEHISNLENLWITPNGDEVEDALAKFRYMESLCCGFYSYLYWDESHPDVEIAKEHHEVNQIYNKEVRSFLSSRNDPHIDSKWLIGNEMRVNGGLNVPSSLYAQWKKLKEFPKGLPERDSETVFVSDYRIDAMVRQIKKWKKGGLVWVYNIDIRHRITAKLRESITNRQIIQANAGDDEIIDNAPVEAIVVASLKSHSQGKNLQRYQNNMYFNGFRTSSLGEQSIARTHRTGQLADELIMQFVYAKGNKSIERFEKARMLGFIQDAYYVHSSMSPQKLITGNWMYKLDNFSDAKLHSMGVVHSHLGGAKRDSFEKRFCM